MEGGQACCVICLFANCKPMNSIKILNGKFTIETVQTNCKIYVRVCASVCIAIKLTFSYFIHDNQMNSSMFVLTQNRASPFSRNSHALAHKVRMKDVSI